MIKNIFAESGAKKTIKQLTIESCIRVHAEAVLKAPFRYGQLRNSLMWKISDGKGGFNQAGGESAPSDQELTSIPKKDEGYVGTNSSYAHHLEFGTKYMAAQPYLRPAADAVKGAKANEIMRKWGQKAMKEEFEKRKVKVKKSG